MRNRRRATGAALAVILMALAVAASLRDRISPAPAAASEPGDCLTAMIEAARDGDVALYLDCFTGKLRKELEAEAATSRPPERFAESLRSSVKDLKGSATSGAEQSGPGEVALIWERVYAKYNERYRVRLLHLDERWRIEALDRIDRGAPAIPYGTPVFPQTPEPEKREEKPPGAPSNGR